MDKLLSDFIDELAQLPIEYWSIGACDIEEQFVLNIDGRRVVIISSNNMGMTMIPISKERGCVTTCSCLERSCDYTRISGDNEQKLYGLVKKLGAHFDDEIQQQKIESEARRLRIENNPPTAQNIIEEVLATIKGTNPA